MTLKYKSLYKAIKRQLNGPRIDPPSDEHGRRPWLHQTFTARVVLPHSVTAHITPWSPGEDWQTLIPGYAWARIHQGRTVEVLGDTYAPRIPDVEHSLIGGLVDPEEDEDGLPIYGLLEKRHRLRHSFRPGTGYERVIPMDLVIEQAERHRLWEVFEEAERTWEGIDVSSHGNTLPDGRHEEVFTCTIYDNEVQVGRYCYEGTDWFWWQLARYAEFFLRLSQRFPPGVRVGFHRGEPSFTEEWSSWHRAEKALERIASGW